MRGYIVDASIPSGAGRCPECGAVVEAGAPEGLCPRCLARVGLGTWAGDASAELPVAETVSLGRFADYDLIEEIGHGGMGTVYKARQLSLNRVVALKMLLGGQYAEAQARARFRAEAEIAAQLQHPHIVAIHEVGEHDGLPFFTMDYIEGRNLADLAQQQPLPAAAAAAYVQTIALAIQYAHEQGVLHRDLKPSNILIDTADQPRVTDFGLAKRLTGSTSDLTVSGQALGSPNFMSPEQASGKHRTVGPTSDIYGLGAILYYLVTSRPPFLADNVGVAVRQVQEQEPVAPRLLNPGVPRDLETLCLKCLQKDPRQRYGSAVELAEELGRFLRGEPIRARPVGRLERVWRWSRRRPGLATLAGVVVALAAVSTTVAVRMVIAQEARDRAQEGMERELYRASIQRATTHLEAGDTELALATLLECPPKFRHWEWGYLAAQCHRAVLELDEAVDPAFNSMLDFIASIEPWSCSFDRAGKRVAAIRPSNGIWVWELPSGKLVLHVHPPAVREAGLLLTPDWAHMVYAPTNQPEVGCVVPLGQTNVVRQLEGHTVGIRRLGISPDGHWVAAWAADGAVRIWDLESGAMQAVLPALSGIQRLQFTADNRRLMAVGSTFLAVHDVQSGERVRWVDHRPDQARGVFPSANAEQWVTADASNRFRLWSAGKPAQNLGRLDADDDDPAKQAVFSPDGRWLCVGATTRRQPCWTRGRGSGTCRFRRRCMGRCSARTAPNWRRWVGCRAFRSGISSVGASCSH